VPQLVNAAKEGKGLSVFQPFQSELHISENSAENDTGSYTGTPQGDDSAAGGQEDQEVDEDDYDGEPYQREDDEAREELREDDLEQLNDGDLEGELPAHSSPEDDGDEDLIDYEDHEGDDASAEVAAQYTAETGNDLSVDAAPDVEQYTAHLETPQLEGHHVGESSHELGDKDVYGEVQENAVDTGSAVYEEIDYDENHPPAEDTFHTELGGQEDAQINTSIDDALPRSSGATGNYSFSSSNPLEFGLVEHRGTGLLRGCYQPGYPHKNDRLVIGMSQTLINQNNPGQDVHPISSSLSSEIRMDIDFDPTSSPEIKANQANLDTAEPNESEVNSSLSEQARLKTDDNDDEYLDLGDSGANENGLDFQSDAAGPPGLSSQPTSTSNTLNGDEVEYQNRHAAHQPFTASGNAITNTEADFDEIDWEDNDKTVPATQPGSTPTSMTGKRTREEDEPEEVLEDGRGQFPSRGE